MGPGGSSESPGFRSRRRAIVALAACAALALATAASAHHGEPATDDPVFGQREPGELGAGMGAASTDTEITPVAKPGGRVGWEHVGGSIWDEDGTITNLVEGSPTPYDLDFYGVGFLDAAIAERDGVPAELAHGVAQRNGFAVGAQCRRDPASPDTPVPAEEVAHCERIPVIFRYHDDFERGLIWEEVYRGDDATDPGGFVAEVAWLGPDRALAVGGDGTYPRRESERLPDETDAEYWDRDAQCRDVGSGPKPGQCEGAGMARAWLFESGSWHELTDLPTQMRALTALGGCISSGCAAGGMAQLWRFQDSGFTTGYGQGLPGQLSSPQNFRFRVRDIRGNWAVTSGCCSASRLDDRPAPIQRSGWSWTAGLGGDSGSFNPDSYYAVFGTAPVVLRTAGGPSERYGPREPPSRFPPPGCDNEACALQRTLAPAVPGAFAVGLATQVIKPDESVPAPGSTLSSLRLLSADGDVAAGCYSSWISPLALIVTGSDATDALPPDCAGPKPVPDGIPDWAVGTLRSSGQGVAYTTVITADRALDRNGALVYQPSPVYAQGPHKCRGDDELVPNSDTGVCSLEGYGKRSASKALYALPSYALNAYRVIGENLAQGDPGTGWAVGDHGAIVSLGSGGASAGENEPARSGASTETRELPGSDAYAEHRRPTAEEPGLVPPLGKLPTQRLPEPRFITASGRGDHKIVMSRDGSEGWAFGIAASGPASSLYHYDGASWSRCDPRGLPGLIPPDPSCSVLAKLPSDATFTVAARVPLERDDDPTNDDEFEVLAGIAKGGQFSALRYREGSWALDEQGLPGGSDLFFTAPDDGWVSSAPAYHYDGERWAFCTNNAQGRELCDDPDARLSALLETKPLGVGGSGGDALEPAPINKRGMRFALAGERVYAFGTRAGTTGATGQRYPMIIYRDADKPCDPPEETEGCWRGGKDDTDDGVYNPTDGGYDPLWDAAQKGGVPDPEDQGRVWAVMAAEESDGSLSGWATGQFNGLDGNAKSVMLRLTDEGWGPYSTGDAADEHLRSLSASLSADGAPDPRQHLALPREAGPRTAFVFGAPRAAPALAFNRKRERWEALATPWVGSQVGGIAADGQGGFWASTGNMYRYTDRPATPVFEEAPNPAGDSLITAMGAGADGSLWLGDEHGRLHRYDRITGWERDIVVPDWDPKRVTVPAEVSAIAVGPDGSGVAVGPGGRIADLEPGGVRLDEAATRGCEAALPSPPCGTSRDLTAAAVAPDGSALVGGKARSLLWRPAGGGFRPADPPPIPRERTIQRISMPRPDRAYLLTNQSEILAGELSEGTWRWQIEIAEKDPLTLVPFSQTDMRPAAIRDVAIDASGRGYAVGDRGAFGGEGLLLARDPDGDWRRLRSGHSASLQRVALPAGGKGGGALIGGSTGLVLTAVRDRLQVVRTPDPYDPLTAGGDDSSKFIDLAILPGFADGEVEAWALIRGPHPSGLRNRSREAQALLHYSSEPDDPLLGLSKATPVPDSQAPRVGEISFAAFGKQDCQLTRRAQASGQGATQGVAELSPVSCLPAYGSNLVHELIARRVGEQIQAQAARAGRPGFALFTGDAADSAGRSPPSVTTVYTLSFAGVAANTPLDRNAKHRRWVELVADPLADGGVPVLGAIGGQDLSQEARVCNFNVEFFTRDCIDARGMGAKQLGLDAGPNLGWRQAMAQMRPPWMRLAEQAGGAGSLRFESVENGALSVEIPDAGTPGADARLGPNADRVAINEQSLGGAPTHYAVDVLRDDEKVARVVVVDTSLRSLAASDAIQQPVEAGGQARWLEEVLCFDGSVEDTDGDVRDCTREPGQQAIVVSNTPTYSYGPINPAETATDAAVFETLMLKHRVNVVVSGRLGWQGRYWTLAPGVHEPCPDQGYVSDSEAPRPGEVRVCGASAAGGEADPGQALDSLPKEARDAAGLADVGAIPFVVSSAAGGKFNAGASRAGQATAENGFWQGYSVVRLDASGDPTKTIVEQRPILDWVGLTAQDRVLEPRGREKLTGFAQEGYGNDTVPRYYEIPDTQVITHRYELVEADPEQPWMPRLDPDAELPDQAGEPWREVSATGVKASGVGEPVEGDGECGPYVCLDPKIGTVDPTAGEVSAGNGKYPDTFAVAILSVGDHVATYPMVFKRSPSFIVNPSVGFPAIPSAPTQTGTAQAPPPPPPPPTPNVPQVNTPQPPPPPPIAPLQAAQPPEPQPPAPPAPPPPSEAPAPISLTLAPPSIAIATPTAVIQPPTPPVNPAPPGGARREARQRQAAAQKSGADNDEQSEAQGLGGDLADGKPIAKGSAFTRHDRTRPEPSFTALARADQPSAWAQGALYSGGIALIAAALAFGFTTIRPGPRRRTPEIPAPAWSKSHFRH